MLRKQKKLGKYEIPREMKSVENLIRPLPLGHIKIMFFLKLVTKKPA